MRADTVFYGANIFSAQHKKFFYGYFSVKNGKILHLGGQDGYKDLEADTFINLEGAYVTPGFIDVHMHIESSMLSPQPFANRLAQCGVTTVVSEPHEIANVLGRQGVEAMIKAAEGAKIDIYYGVPSSVPSTSAEFETTGGTIELEDLKALMKSDAIKCLGEVMNTRKVLSDPEDKQVQFVNYLKQNYPHIPIEGHCPRIVGHDLNQYVFTGIDSDHTEHTLEEVKQRILNGVLVQLQHKMIKEDVLDYVVKNELYESVCFVTDDVMTDILVDSGHLDAVVFDAVQKGFPVEKAIYCATKVPAQRMRLYDRGQLTPGKIADFIVFEDISKFKIAKTYKNGSLIADNAVEKAGGGDAGAQKAFPAHFYETMHIAPLTAQQCELKTAKADGEYTANAIETTAASTHTKLKKVRVQVKGGVVSSGEANPILVFERHGKNGGVGYGLISGASMLKEGAVATSYSHDHHNLLVTGANAQDMALAANRVISMGGGMAVACNGSIIGSVALPVAGLMSERTAQETANEVRSVTAAMREVGYDHYSPIMSLATVCLPVSPDVRITDKGVIDVLNGKIIDLIDA